MREQDDWLTRSKRVTPGGSQTSSRRYPLVGTTEYPRVAVASMGAHIYFDEDKRERAIDLAGANATCPLGANNPRVIEGVLSELGTGGSLSLPSTLECRVSESFVNLFPVERMVRWVRTGSEAVSGAVAIAQLVTGRDRVAVFSGGYHGWHPWTRELTTSVPSLVFDRDRGIDKFTCDLSTMAALVVESPRWFEVDGEYTERLCRVRDACEEHGTLLIFDDVVYGFRFSTIGLLGRTNVVPSLACFSKALGNGYPVGCIVGDPEVMNTAAFRVSSTFGGETCGLAAAEKVIGIHETQDVCGQLRDIGVKLQRILSLALDGSPIRLEGTPQHFKFVCDDVGILDEFLNHCVNDEVCRVLIHRDANNVNLALDEIIREQIAETVYRSVVKVSHAH